MSPYFPLNMPKVQERSRAADEGSSFDDDIWLNWKVGQNVFRILPSWSKAMADEGLFAKVVWRHYALPSSDGKQANHVCVEQNHPKLGIVCPICQVIRDLESKGHDLGNYRCRFKAFVNAVDRDEAAKMSVPKVRIVSLTPGVYHWVLRTIADPYIGDITDPYKGVYISVTKSGTGIDTEYSPNVLPGREPVVGSPEAVENILGSLHNLDDIFKVPNEEIMKIIQASADALRRKYAISDKEQPNPVVPPPMQESNTATDRAFKSLAADLNRYPTEEEVAKIIADESKLNEEIMKNIQKVQSATKKDIVDSNLVMDDASIRKQKPCYLLGYLPGDPVCDICAHHIACSTKSAKV